MAALSGRRSVMALFSAPDCIFSHTCRFVLLEKAVECDIVDTTQPNAAEELAQVNPYNETPALVDRELIIYGAQIINEYLEERLPHPPLMPVDPVNRARARLIMMRFDREWLSAYARAAARGKPLTTEHRKEIRDGLISMSPALSDQPYMLGEEFSLVDCVIAPFLWRLPVMGIELPHQAQSVIDYGERLFSRPAFAASLTEVEKDMRRK
ncbi:MAG TPA: glutathione S-transferase N-terminal domain-containing protein [Arenicellales bacterium]|nr:glutathione S-transferase N-terminal domain-containing protein [Arenicellales bacterium]